MTRYKHRLDTMDGPIELEDNVPPTPVKTPEEKAEEQLAEMTGITDDEGEIEEEASEDADEVG
jgi:hypothetical protein